jgi:hypothetical protein
MCVFGFVKSKDCHTVFALAGLGIYNYITTGEASHREECNLNLFEVLKLTRVKAHD